MMPSAVMKLRNAVAPASTFYAQVMAQGPVNYWRNGEASGSVMVDEVAAAGTYSGAVSLGNAALYPGAGAGTSIGGNFALGSIGCGSNSIPASLASMTLLTIVRPTFLTGVKLLGVQRDENGSGGTRFWQWRSNGADMEFVKAGTGVFVLSAPSVLAINTTYFLGFEVDASGNYAMYVNGIAVKTGTATPVNYGGAGDPYRIGASAGSAAVLDGRTCENAVFDKVLGPTVHAALFAATGL